MILWKKESIGGLYIELFYGLQSLSSFDSRHSDHISRPE